MLGGPHGMSERVQRMEHLFPAPVLELRTVQPRFCRDTTLISPQTKWCAIDSSQWSHLWKCVITKCVVCSKKVHCERNGLALDTSVPREQIGYMRVSRCSPVGMLNRLQDRWIMVFLAEERSFSLLQSIRTDPEDPNILFNGHHGQAPQISIQWTPRPLSPVEKRSGRKTHDTRAKNNNARSYIIYHHSPIRLYRVHSDYFTPLVRRFIAAWR